MLKATVFAENSDIVAEIFADDELGIYEELHYFSYIREDEYEEYYADDCWKIVIEDETGAIFREIYQAEESEDEED